MLDFRAFQALTFDCYGTLIDWESGLLSVLEPWAEQHGISLRGDQLLEAFAEAESRIESENPSVLYPDILRQTMRSIAKELGAEPDAKVENELAESVGAWPAFPDSAAALQALKKHYKLVIVSNVDRASFAQSNRQLGVDFDVIVTAQDVGSYKPNPGHFQAALKRLVELGVPADRVLHVAQSLYHDHVPAKKLGLKSVWINRRHAKGGQGATQTPGGPVMPDVQYPSMQAFASVVETAFRPASRP